MALRLRALNEARERPAVARHRGHVLAIDVAEAAFEIAFLAQHHAVMHQHAECVKRIEPQAKGQRPGRDPRTRRDERWDLVSGQPRLFRRYGRGDFSGHFHWRNPHNRETLYLIRDECRSAPPPQATTE